MTQYVGYTRVSTESQGLGGYGMAAQDQAIEDFLAKSGGDLLCTFKELESGRKNLRPELGRALDHARKKKAVLLIAKLDRLSRSVAFIAKMMESEVEFKCCDRPDAGRLELHIWAAFAEEERRLISKRTREGLVQAKARGAKLGCPCPEKGAETMRLRADKFARDARELIDQLRAHGKNSYAEVAEALNKRQTPTPSGRGKWHQRTVIRVLERET